MLFDIVFIYVESIKKFVYINDTNFFIAVCPAGAGGIPECMPPSGGGNFQSKEAESSNSSRQNNTAGSRAGTHLYYIIQIYRIVREK